MRDRRIAKAAPPRDLDASVRADVDAMYDALAKQVRPASPSPSTPAPAFKLCGVAGCARLLFAGDLFCSRGHARASTSTEVRHG
jgi:hypothetical protein